MGWRGIPGSTDNTTIAPTRKKSAKDLAFEKERTEYRRQIRGLEYEILKQDTNILELLKIKSNLETQIEKLEDWNCRLLEYTELTPEDLKMLIKKEKTVQDFTAYVNAMFGIRNSDERSVRKHE